MGNSRGREAGVVAVLAAALAFGAGTAEAARVDWSVASDAEPGVFHSKNGLKLRGSCNGGSLGVRLLTNAPKRSARMVGVNSHLGGLTDEHHYLGIDRLHEGNDGGELFGAGRLSGNADSSVGQFIYASRKRVTSIDWTAEVSDAIGAQCLFGGVATSGKRKTKRAMIFRANEGSTQRKIYDEPFQLRVLAKCNETPTGPDLDVTLKTGSGTSGVYANSQSDADANDADEQAFVAHEGFGTNEPLALDTSGVASDHASGQIFVAASNTQFAIDWIATSSRALRKDCAFAATVTQAGSGSERRAVYGRFGADPEAPFFDFGDLELTGGCVGEELSLSASPLVNGASIHQAFQSDADADGTDSHSYSEDDSFDTANDLNLITAAEDEDLLGQLVLASPDGGYTTLDYVADEDELYGGADCSLGGVASRAPAP